jgi:U3 small nucleolar RNA-associated protein 15
VKKTRLAPYDAMLKRFQYHDALDAALETKRAVVICTVLDELVQRSALRLALSSRDDRTLQPLLKFMLKTLTNPRYATLLIDVANIVLGTLASLSS